MIENFSEIYSNDSSLAKIEHTYAGLEDEVEICMCLSWPCCRSGALLESADELWLVEGTKPATLLRWTGAQSTTVTASLCWILLAEFFYLIRSFRLCQRPGTMG